MSDTWSEECTSEKKMKGDTVRKEAQTKRKTMKWKTITLSV